MANSAALTSPRLLTPLSLTASPTSASALTLSSGCVQIHSRTAAVVPFVRGAALSSSTVHRHGDLHPCLTLLHGQRPTAQLTPTSSYPCSSSRSVLRPPTMPSSAPASSFVVLDEGSQEQGGVERPLRTTRSTRALRDVSNLSSAHLSQQQQRAGSGEGLGKRSATPADLTKAKISQARGGGVLGRSPTPPPSRTPQPSPLSLTPSSSASLRAAPAPLMTQRR